MYVSVTCMPGTRGSQKKVLGHQELRQLGATAWVLEIGLDSSVRAASDLNAEPSPQSQHRHS